MTTRMVHPLHGATHAYDNSEIERLKGFGWAVDGEKPAGDEHLDLIKTALKTAFPPVVFEKRKPGRPANAK